MAEAESAGETFAIEGRVSTAAAAAAAEAAARDDDRHTHADDREAKLAIVKQQQFVLPVKARRRLGSRFPWAALRRAAFP